MLALMSGGLFAGVKLAPAISGLSTSITSWQIEGVGGKRKLGTSYGVGKRGRWGANGRSDKECASDGVGWGIVLKDLEMLIMLSERCRY